MRMHQVVKGAGKRLALACLIGGALATTACVLGPKYEAPPVPTAEEWRATSAQFVGQPVDTVQWWKRLNDPVLDSLIEMALRENSSIQVASLRVVQARVTRTSVTLTNFPLVTGSGSAARVEMSQNVKPEVEVDRNERDALRSPNLPESNRPGVVIPTVDGSRIDGFRQAVRAEIAESLPSISVTPEIDTYDVGFDAIWEIDMWGNRRQAGRAARAEVDAAYALYDDMMVSVAAEVARTYVELRAAEKRLEALNSVVELMTEFEKATKERHERGDALVTDVKLASLLTGIVRSNVPDLEARRRQLENSLCVLIGRAPEDLGPILAGSNDIPTAPLESMVGVPADLLRRRPDVRMAERYAAAHCARVGMAKSNIMPSFSIFGAAGYRSSDSENLFESASVRSAYGGLLKVTNLINYPITINNVRVKDARFREALIAYRETVLRANMEVENSMYAFLRSRDQQAILEENVKTAQETADLTIAAYKEGKVIVSVPLVALTFLASQRDQYETTRAEGTINYVATYKALGGGWETRVGQELVPEHIQEQMRKQVDWWTFGGKRIMSTAQKKKEENPS